jgi:CotS family spore coat protein
MMDKAFLYTRSIDIEDAEMELLENILKEYDINYKSVEKVRSAYKVSDESNSYCLKMLGRGYKRANKSYFLSNKLRERGFDHVAPYIYTKNDEYLIKHKKSSFYITDWIDGKEVDFKNLDDILDSARFLAQFHNAAKDLEIPASIKIRNRHSNWMEHFNQHIKSVKGFAEKIEKKPKRGFDLIFKNNMHIFMQEAEFAVALLNTKEAKHAFAEAERERTLCHDSFYYQNILRDQNGKLYLVDLESSLLDCPMSDLGKLIRRIICKTKFKWDFDLCRRIIDAYDSVRPISREELYPLLAMIAFPHKYWKFGKKRYIKKKKWSEEDYQNKLKKIINLQNYKFELVRNFVMFYGIHID